MALLLQRRVEGEICAAGQQGDMVPTGRPADHRSRARRWTDVVAELLQLQAQYAALLEALPALRDSATAEALQAICDLELSEQMAIETPRARSIRVVRRLHEGIQSLLSIGRVDARRMNASAIAGEIFPVLAGRRQRLNQPMVGSTIQRVGRTTKAWPDRNDGRLSVTRFGMQCLRRLPMVRQRMTTGQWVTEREAAKPRKYNAEQPAAANAARWCLARVTLLRSSVTTGVCRPGCRCAPAALSLL